MLGDPVTDMSLAMEMDYFRLARDRYFVPLAVKIPGSEIELARHGGADTTRLDFIGQVKDQKGTLVGNVRDNIEIKLKGETTQQLTKTTLAYDTGFSLAPGTYTVKFLARENETGKMGTFESKFVVPDLTAEQKYLPISSVVLSNQRQKLETAVATAERDKKLLAQMDALITIPHSPRVESLNAGVAASIILYEAARQRGTTAPAHLQTHASSEDQ